MEESRQDQVTEPSFTFLAGAGTNASLSRGRRHGRGGRGSGHRKYQNTDLTAMPALPRNHLTPFVSESSRGFAGFSFLAQADESHGAGFPSISHETVGSVFGSTMKSPASLIIAIDSVLKNTNLKLEQYVNISWEKVKLKIGLRTLKVFLILCLREVDDDDVTHSMKCSWSQASLFARIEDVLARIPLLQNMHSTIVDEVHSLGKELDDESSKSMRPASSPLPVDKLLQIADSVLENIADLLSWFGELSRIPPNIFEVIYAFEVHTEFMKNFIAFVEGTGVEQQPLLFHIQSTMFNAARVFIKFGDDTAEWGKVIGSECSIVNRMATDPHLYQTYTQALTTSKLLFSRSQDTPLDDQIINNFLSSLISLLWDVLRHSDPEYTSKHQFKVLYERLRFSRAILRNCKDEKIKCEVGVLICDAGVLISSLHQIDTEKLCDLMQRFGMFQVQVELKTNPSKAIEELSSGGFTQIKISDDGSKNQLKSRTPILSHQPTPSGPPISSKSAQDVVFQHDELTSVLDQLTIGSKQLHIVPIAGMAGLGKTTFALKLYNHSSVMHHFYARAWCAISQVLDKKAVLLELLNQIQPGNHSELTEEDLANKLRRSLKGKRYLILLDDVWTPQVWDDLKASFPDDSTDSRIIITSRRLDIAPDPYLLRFRLDEECLEILEMKLLHTEGWDRELGMKIAKVCKGLPLTAVIVAGLLSKMHQQGWEGILDDLSLSSVGGVDRALDLSYQHLPDNLHQCYLYLGAFPEDMAISVKRLIRLWMAEGFVQEEESKEIEDVAREYVDELIERSLVMVDKTRSIGGVRKCRMHDLLRDFCQVKSKQENLFHLLQQRRDELSNFNEPCNLERLAIHSDPTHFKESKLFCPHAKSILLFCPWTTLHVFDMSFIIQIFRLLKVLDISEVLWTNEIPSEIQFLSQLRFLSIWSSVAIIPSSIGMLYNLVTFVASFWNFLSGSFPLTLLNLRNLRHLCVKGDYSGFTLPTEDVEIFSNLIELEGIVFCSDDGNMEKQLRKFPNIRKLNCSVVKSSMEESHKVIIPECLSQLESLSIWGDSIWGDDDGKLKCEFGSTDKLRKLELRRFELSREEIAVIGKLPNLEVLKLLYNHFPGNTLEMEEGEFQKLRILKIRDLDKALERWTASDDQLPCLQKLVFWKCEVLKELPSCLETSSTLGEIEVRNCSSTLESAIRDIVEGHKDYGNSVELHIKPEWDFI